MKILSLIKNQLAKNRPAVGTLRIAANVADAETVSIGGEVYEFDSAADPGAITAGRIRVNVVAGLTPTIASAALVAAIHANTRQNLRATAISVNEVLVEQLDGVPLALAETMGGASNAWDAATMVGGSTADVFKGLALVSKAVTAQDVALTAVRFSFPFTVAAFIVIVRTSAGVQDTAPDGAQTATANRVSVAVGTTIAAGDIVTVLASA